jgi:hypothetical protein
MRVRCIANTKAGVAERFWEDVDAYVHLDELNLSVGRSYEVFGLAFRNDRVWYLVCEESDAEYPVLHLGAFFSLEDARVPSGWVLTTTPNNLGSGVSLLPESWAADPSFLEKLVDGDGPAVAYFEQLKASV